MGNAKLRHLIKLSIYYNQYQHLAFVLLIYVLQAFVIAVC